MIKISPSEVIEEFEKWWDDWGKCPGDEENNYRKFLAREGFKAAFERANEL